MNGGPCLVPSNFFDVGQVFSLDRRAFSGGMLKGVWRGEGGA